MANLHTKFQVSSLSCSIYILGGDMTMTL